MQQMNSKKTSEPDQVAAEIIDQTWLEHGYSRTQLEQSKQVADLLDRLVASGCSMESILKEWQDKSAEEILHEYASKESSLNIVTPLVETNARPV